MAQERLVQLDPEELVGHVRALALPLTRQSRPDRTSGIRCSPASKHLCSTAPTGECCRSYSRTLDAANEPPPSRMSDPAGAHDAPPCGAACSAIDPGRELQAVAHPAALIEGVFGQPSPCRSASPSTLPVVETRSTAAGSALGARASSRASVKPPSTRWLAPQRSLELSECVLTTLPNRDRARQAGRQSVAWVALWTA